MINSLDEAIAHCEEVAENQEWMAKNYDDDSMGAKVCLECASERRQLAEWLKKLKAYEEAREEIIRTRDSGHMERTCCDGLNHAICIIDEHLKEVNANEYVS